MTTAARVPRAPSCAISYVKIQNLPCGQQMVQGRGMDMDHTFGHTGGLAGKMRQGRGLGICCGDVVFIGGMGRQSGQGIHTGIGPLRIVQQKDMAQAGEPVPEMSNTGIQAAGGQQGRRMTGGQAVQSPVWPCPVKRRFL